MSKDKRRGLITVEQTRTSWMESELFVFSFFCCANIWVFSACLHFPFFSLSFLAVDVRGYWERIAARKAIQ